MSNADILNSFRSVIFKPILLLCERDDLDAVLRLHKYIKDCNNRLLDGLSRNVLGKLVSWFTDKESDMLSYLREIDSEESISESEVSIQRLKDQGVDVSDLEEALDQVKAGYDNAYGKVDSDEAAVNSYVEQFYNVESRIIQEERKHQKKKDDSKNDDAIKEARSQIENYGDEEAKAAWAELEESYELADTAEEKSFIANKMSNLGFQAMTTNYGWLKAFFSVILSKPETKYTNAQKAEYWKSQAYLAMDSKNATHLRKAVFELLDLMTSSANQAVSAFGADLTM